MADICVRYSVTWHESWSRSVHVGAPPRAARPPSGGSPRRRRRRRRSRRRSPRAGSDASARSPSPRARARGACRLCLPRSELAGRTDGRRRVWAISRRGRRSDRDERLEENQTERTTTRSNRRLDASTATATPPRDAAARRGRRTARSEISCGMSRQPIARGRSPSGEDIVTPRPSVPPSSSRADVSETPRRTDASARGGGRDDRGRTRVARSTTPRGVARRVVERERESPFAAHLRSPRASARRPAARRRARESSTRGGR